jgi:hypothetical protein
MLTVFAAPVLAGGRKIPMYKSMTADKYITERIDDQCTYYDGSARKYKTRHFVTRRTAVVGAAIVPILTSIPLDKLLGDYRNMPATLVSLLVTIIVALETVNRYGDQWKNFRSTYEFLKAEKYHFQTGDGAYRNMDGDTAFSLLVERCESRIAMENSATLSIISSATNNSEQPLPASRSVDASRSSSV